MRLVLVQGGESPELLIVEVVGEAGFEPQPQTQKPIPGDLHCLAAIYCCLPSPNAYRGFINASITLSTLGLLSGLRKNSTSFPTISLRSFPAHFSLGLAPEFFRTRSIIA